MFTKLVVLIMSLVISLTSALGLNFTAPEEEAAEVKNVIILIGDGMGFNHLHATENADCRRSEFQFVHHRIVCGLCYGNQPVQLGCHRGRDVLDRWHRSGVAYQAFCRQIRQRCGILNSCKNQKTYNY